MRLERLRNSRLILYVALVTFTGWTIFVYGKFYRQLNFEWRYLAAGTAATLFGAKFLPEALKTWAKSFLARVTAIGALLVFLATLAAAPQAMVVFINMVLVAWLLGSAILRWSGLAKAVSTTDALVYAIALGWAGISVGAAVFGALHLLRTELFLPVFVLGAGWALWSVRDVSMVRNYQLCHRRLGELDGAGWLMLLLLLLILVHALISNLAPSVLSDDLIYHRAIAKIFVREGNIGFVPYYSHFNMPFGQEMLYATGLVLGGGDQVIGLVNMGYDALLFGAFMVLGRALGGYAIGAAASLMLFSVPWWIIHLNAGSTDLKFLTFTLLATHAFLRWRETRETTYIGLCGAFVGCSLHYRYQGLILFGFFILLGIIHLRFDFGARRNGVRLLALFAVIASLVGSPWLIRNLINTGNPFFPTSPRGFDGFFGDAELSEIWRSFGDPNWPWLYATFGYGASLKSFFALPWQLTFAGWAFEGYELNPILLGAFPILFLIWRQTSATKICLAFAAFYTLAWFTEVQIVKFLIPAFALMSLAYGAIFFRESAPKGAVRSLLLSVFVLLPTSRSLIYLGVDAKARWQGALRVATREQTPEAYILERMSDQEVIFFANRHLPENAVIFSVNETQLYYLKRKYIYGHPTSQLLVDYRTMPQFPDLLARLRQLGVTHLLCHVPFKPDISQLLSSSDAAQAILLRDLDSSYLRKIHETHGLALFEISYPPDLPAYTGAAAMDPVLCGDFLLEYGMLERARVQFAKAGQSGAAQRERIDRMGPLDRARFYVSKARQFKWAYFIKPAVNEYELALKTSSDPSESGAILQEIAAAKDLARGLAPHTWGRALND